MGTVFLTMVASVVNVEVTAGNKMSTVQLGRVHQSRCRTHEEKGPALVLVVFLGEFLVVLFCHITVDDLVKLSSMVFLSWYCALIRAVRWVQVWQGAGRNRVYTYCGAFVPHSSSLFAFRQRPGRDLRFGIVVQSSDEADVDRTGWTGLCGLPQVKSLSSGRASLLMSVRL